ncbi:MAG: serine/threonine protein kinase [Myxococcaceae bacterium]|nr:MAG: serine/threonine protein kinase [Myxococcaceae bacterium]
MLTRGDVIGGKYKLIDPLGEGGMGAVWIAENLSIRGAEVAVKVLHANFARDPDAVRRFRAEAEATVRIGHPSIVRVFDYGQSDDGSPYMVMERLHGESLADRLERDRSLPVAEAVEVVTAVLEALDAAHQREILHRDLKPENIFMAREGDVVRPKILDFGVSKFLGDDAERVRMTRTGALIGTPAYMSPEQARGETAIDLRSDVWAMGVILYELLTGRLPYEAANYNAMMIRIATEGHLPLTEALPDIDPVLASIAERAMARTARERYATARQMREALLAWSRGEGVLEATPRGSLPPARTSRSPMPTLVDADTLPGDSLSTLRKEPPRRYALALALLGALAVGGALLSWRQRSTPRGPETTAAALSRQRGAATHSLTITGLPSGARVLLDDAPVTLPTALRGEGDHRVRVEVDGAPAWMAVVPRPTADVSLAYVAPSAVMAAAVDAGAPAVEAPVARAVARRAVPRRADAGRATPGTLLARDPGF